MNKAAFILLFLILIASNGWSADGPYIGAGPTLTRIESDSFDAVEVGYKLFGGWRLSENFAIEASWQDLGGFNEDGIKVDVDGYTVEALAITPDLDGVRFFGKIGYFDFSIEEKSFGGNFDEDGLLLGVGLLGNLQNNVGVGLELNWADAADLVLSGALTFKWYFAGPN